MDISEEEAIKLIAHIERTMREASSEPNLHGIINILNQWRADVDAGRQVERRLIVSQSPGLDKIAEVPRSRSPVSGEFVGKEEYTPHVQLDMLVNALAIAFIAPPMMAQRFINAITEYSEATVQTEPVIHLVGVGEKDGTEASSSSKISHKNIAQTRQKTSAITSILMEISKDENLAKRNLQNYSEIH